MAVPLSRLSPSLAIPRASAALERAAMLNSYVRPFAHPPTVPDVQPPDGPLAGSLVVVQDLIDANPFPTHMGYPSAWQAKHSPEDSKVVAALRRHGAYILGKGATSPYGWYSPAIPRLPNPWDPSCHLPSGAAVAVSTGIADIGVGVQTLGSVVRYASQAGVVGWKSSYGSVPTSGALERCHLVDSIGFFTRTAEDMLHLYKSVCDEESEEVAETTVGDGLYKSDEAVSIREVFPWFPKLPDAPHTGRIGALSTWGKFSVFAGECLTVFGEKVNVLEVAHPVYNDIDEVIRKAQNIVSRSMAANEHKGPAPEEGYPVHYGSIVGVSRGGERRVGDYFQERWRHMVEAFTLREWDLDALVCPVTPLPVSPTSPLPSEADFTGLFSFSGHPMVSLPLSRCYKGAHPMSVLLVGRLGRDGELLRLAVSLEKALGVGEGYTPLWNLEPLDMVIRGSEVGQRAPPTPPSS